MMQREKRAKKVQDLRIEKECFSLYLEPKPEITKYKNYFLLSPFLSNQTQKNCVSREVWKIELCTKSKILKMGILKMN